MTLNLSFRKSSSILLGIFISLTGPFAKGQVAFTYSPNPPCANTPVQFTDVSTGTYHRWLWTFFNYGGDTSTLQNPVHTFPYPGAYSVLLAATDTTTGRTDSVITFVTVYGVANFSFHASDTMCSLVTYSFTNLSEFGANTFSYNWDFGDNTSSTEKNPIHPYIAPGNYIATLTATDTHGCVGIHKDTITVGIMAGILPATGALSLTANRECLAQDGWTHYFNNSGTALDTADDVLLLSLKKNGNNIGSVGDGTFQLQTAATSGAGSNSAVLLTNPLIPNPGGMWVMNRYWQVTATQQPSSEVGVRFYFNSQDLSDVNGSFASHNLDYKDLFFYKTVGGNPDPTTNLAGATRIIGIYNGAAPDTSTWIYADLLQNRHMAEFTVSSFSGGGGGITVNGFALPVRLLTFSGIRQNGEVVLHWTTADEVDIDRFEIERSVEGLNFSYIGNVRATNSTGNNQVYSFRFVENATQSNYVRLHIIDKNSKGSYSKILNLGKETQTGTIKIYPQPASDYLTVATDEFYSGYLSLRIHNVSGTLVKKVDYAAPLGNRFDLNISSLPAGIYKVILVEREIKKGSATFIINR